MTYQCLILSTGMSDSCQNDFQVKKHFLHMLCTEREQVFSRIRSLSL